MTFAEHREQTNWCRLARSGESRSEQARAGKQEAGSAQTLEQAGPSGQRNQQTSYLLAASGCVPLSSSARLPRRPASQIKAAQMFACGASRAPQEQSKSSKQLAKHPSYFHCAGKLYTSRLEQAGALRMAHSSQTKQVSSGWTITQIAQWPPA